MKTPRQILLERHNPSQPRLDSLRREVLRALEAGSEPWWLTAWREIVLIARPAWTAIGAAGVLAVGLQLASMERQPAAPGRAPGSAADAATVRNERSRLWAELFGVPPESPSTEPKTSSHESPPHRSQLPITLWAV